MKRSRTELLAELAQLDPERPPGKPHRSDSGSDEAASAASERTLARVLATPRVHPVADRATTSTSDRRIPGTPTRYRRVGVVVTILALGGLILGFVISTNGKTSVRSAAHRASSGAGLHPVLTALTSTTAAESYAFSYSTTFQPGKPSNPLTTSGYGVVNLQPYAMLTTNSPKSSFPNVTGVFDSTDVWEFGAGDYGTHGPQGSSPGMPLAGFAQSVEGSLGQGQGALEMIGLSYPTGRLNLDQSTVTSAQEIGTGSVDGLAVTNYQVSVDLSRVLDQPGLTDEQRATITQALAILSSQGYEGTTEVVSIDGAGFIREVKSVATFSDGGSVINDSLLSDIGCAGTVIPGQPVPTPAPPGCVSPDRSGGDPATIPPSGTVPGSPTSTPMNSPTTTVPLPTPSTPGSTPLTPGSNS